MTAPRPSKIRLGNHLLHPETQMLNYGYDPELSEGAVKPPVFLTSTFVFKTAEDGRDFFDFVSGRKEPPAGVGAGLVYSRFNHPNSELWRTVWRSMRGRKVQPFSRPACPPLPPRFSLLCARAMSSCIRSHFMVARKRFWRRPSSILAWRLSLLRMVFTRPPSRKQPKRRWRKVVFRSF